MPARTRPLVIALSLLVGVIACGDDAAPVVDGSTGGEEATTGTTSGPETTEASDSTAAPDPWDDPFDDACAAPDGPVCCDEDDLDRDGVAEDVDNAPDTPNKGQADADGDGFGDVIDLCPLLDSDDPFNSHDEDRDGIGDACDLCPGSEYSYNWNVANYAPPWMLVRSIPTNMDFDGDGIGDACDNCVAVPNCVSLDDPECQRDTLLDGIGNACDDEEPVAGAAGPVGYGDADDFDQDGLPNAGDECPRLPLALEDRIACTDDTDCPAGRVCGSAGTCGHVDNDGDGVGDICDTCPYVANPEQDSGNDRDFIGSACEATPLCEDVRDRGIGYFEVSANGACCVPLIVEADDGSGDLIGALSCADPAGPFDAENCTQLRAPDPTDPLHSRVLRLECTSDDCIALDPSIAERVGFLVLPPGCEEALAAAGMTARENLVTGRIDASVDPSVLEARACRLPLQDADLDGVGDSCDLCEHAHDPEQDRYVDGNGTEWLFDGALCNGDFGCH